MAVYHYRCKMCGWRSSFAGSIQDGPPEMFCRVCQENEPIDIRTPMARDYRADNIAIAAVSQATFVASVGAEVSDPRQMDEHLKRLTQQSVDRVGYEPKLRARHPSEVAKDPGYAEATEAYKKSQRDAVT